MSVCPGSLKYLPVLPLCVETLWALGLEFLAGLWPPCHRHRFQVSSVVVSRLLHLFFSFLDFADICHTMVSSVTYMFIVVNFCLFKISYCHISGVGMQKTLCLFTV